MEKPSDKIFIAGTVDPDNQAAGTVVSDWVAVKHSHQYMALLCAGVIDTNGTLDAKIRQATDSSGTGAKDVTGLAITQLTQAGTDSDKQVIINIDPIKLDIENGFNHIALSVTTATAASYVCGVILGVMPGFKPTDSIDLSTVDEIVG